MGEGWGEGDSSSQSTGVGIVASTQNGPVTRVMPLCCSGTVHKNLLLWRFVVRNGFESHVGNDTPNLFALFVLLAFINEAAGWTTLLILEFVPGKSTGQQPLPSERQRHPAGINRDPASAPLFGDIGSRAASAGGIKDKIPWIGGHEDAALNDQQVSEQHKACLSLAYPAYQYLTKYLSMEKQGSLSRKVIEVWRIRIMPRPFRSIPSLLFRTKILQCRFVGFPTFEQSWRFYP